MLLKNSFFALQDSVATVRRCGGLVYTSTGVKFLQNVAHQKL